MCNRDHKRPDEYAAFAFCVIAFIVCIGLALIRPEACKLAGHDVPRFCVD